MVYSDCRQWLFPSQGGLPSHTSRTTHHRSVRVAQGHWKGFLWQGHASTKEGHHARLCSEDHSKGPYCIPPRRDHPHLGRENSLGLGQQPIHRPSQVFIPESRQALLGDVIWCVCSGSCQGLYRSAPSQRGRTILSFATRRQVRPRPQSVLRRRVALCTGASA